MKQTYCKEFSPLINQFLIDYSKELGLKVSASEGEHKTEYPYIGYSESFGICRVNGTFMGEQLTLTEFIEYLKGIRPKVLVYGGRYEVNFNPGYIHFAGVTLSNEDVNNIQKNLIQIK